MCHGRNEIGDEDGRVLAILDDDGLEKGHMTGHQPGANPRQDLFVTLDQLPASDVGDGFEVWREIAGLCPFVGMASVLQLTLLNHVGRIGKSEPHSTALAHRVTTGVIEVEMRVDHPTNVLRFDAGLGQRVLELCRSGSAYVGHAVDVRELLALLVADAGIEQRRSVGMVDQDASERERDAIAIVGGNPTRPQRPGNDAEHCPAVEFLDSRFQRMTA